MHPIRHNRQDRIDQNRYTGRFFDTIEFLEEL